MPLRQLRDQLDIAGRSRAGIRNGDGVSGLPFEIAPRRAGHGHGKRRGDNVEFDARLGPQLGVAAGLQRVDDVPRFDGRHRQFDLPRLARLQRADFEFQIRCRLCAAGRAARVRDSTTPVAAPVPGLLIARSSSLRRR